MGYRGVHLLRNRWFQGVGAREVLTSVVSIGFAGGLVAGTMLADRAASGGDLAPSTRSAPPPTVTAPPTTRPETPPGGGEKAPPAGGAATSQGEQPPGAQSPPSTESGEPATTTAAATTTPTTTGASSATRPCRKVILHTRPHITVVVCIPVRK
jgi:hypothetical protein